MVLASAHGRFRLKVNELSYHKSEAGDLMGSVPMSAIVQVTALRPKADFLVSLSCT